MSPSDRTLILDPAEFRALEQLLDDADVHGGQVSGLGRLKIKVDDLR